MIPTKQNVDSNLAGLESQNFSIQITDKSFRVLLDGLYTNKEQSIVRELWTNAYDSHVSAGIPDQPFHCKIPSDLDPVFSVRDYGTSMTHEDIMHLYSTVFASTKTSTNDQIGCLGLGSKSPFAYTDSFTVFAFDDNTKRTYLAALNSDGIPTITYLSSEPSDEPRGLEVSFSVTRDSVPRFKTAAANVVIGFNPAPTITGPSINIPEPIFEGDEVRIYYSDNYYNGGKTGLSGHMVKMGPVAYPIPSEFNNSITSNYYSGKSNDFRLKNHVCLMVDVPIGSIDFTANREALQLTDQTRQNLAAAIQSAMDRLEATIKSDIDSSKTYLDACKTFSYWNGITSMEPHRYKDNPKAPMVSQTVELGHKLTRDLVFKVWNNKTVERVMRNSAGFHVSKLDDLMFVINRDPKMPRRMVRFKAYSDTKDDVYWLDHPTDDQIKKLKRLLGLTDSQFILIEDIPDVEVVRNSSGSSTSSGMIRGLFKMDAPNKNRYPSKINHSDGIPDSYYWVKLDSTATSADIVLPKSRFRATLKDSDWGMSNIYDAVRYFDIDAPIMFASKQGLKHLDLEANMSLDDFIMDKMDEMKDTIIRHEMLSKAKYPLHRKSYDVLNIPNDSLPVHVRSLADRLYSSDINSSNMVEEMVNKYPLLFDSNVDESVINDYINYVNNK